MFIQLTNERGFRMLVNLEFTATAVERPEGGCAVYPSTSQHVGFIVRESFDTVLERMGEGTGGD